MNEFDKKIDNIEKLAKEAKKLVESFDFSKHDKVFEDKIAKLEENIGYYKDSFYRAEKNCNKLHHENNELKQEKLDKNKKIAELVWENELLKQRIDELESRGTEKSTKYTTVIVAKEINGQEYVRLEDFISVVNDFQA